MLTNTPRQLTPALEALAERLVPGGTPRYILNRPRRDAVPLECYGAVDAQVAEHGGAVQYGWALWEWPGTMIEAEFHAVWVDPDGTLRDVSRYTRAVDRILFVPDPVRRFEERAIDNVRVPLRDDPKLARFIALAERRFAIMNAGERAEQFGAVSVTMAEARELAAIDAETTRLQHELQRGTPQPGRNEPCPCGSGAKFKKCHGKA